MASVPPKLPSKHHPHVLFVEGRDDLYTVAALLAARGYDYSQQPWSPLMKELGGIDVMAEALPVALKAAPLRRVGLIVDADLDLAARWASVTGAFARAGVQLPAQPAPSGLILDRADWPIAVERVGVWVMPNNALAGTLESFLQHLVPGEDPIWTHAKAATARAISEGAPLGEGQRAKGELHAWLAWQERPGIPYGVAITAKVLRHEAPLASAFVAWLRALYEG